MSPRDDKDDDDKGMGTSGEIRRREEFAIKEAARKREEQERQQRELERAREAERRRRESDK